MTAGDDLQVLLVTPTGRDAELLQNVLNAAEVQSEPLQDIAAAVQALRTRELGALLIAEEALRSLSIARLAATLKKQPPWSALPVLILTAPGQHTPQIRRQTTRWAPLGEITLLERPIRVPTLISSVKTALHARRRQYERRLSEAALRQSEKLAAVGRLASSIAHEINNPLEAVMNLLYILDGTPLDPQQRRYLETARQELTRVSEITIQTLTFNRQRDVEGLASIASLLDSVLLLYQGRLAGANIHIERSYHNTPPVRCFPGELRQVFANLIGNAFDATRQGGRVLLRERAATHPKTARPGIRITIADTGHGIPADIKTHLFEAFKSTKGINGSGLGLWISKGIVEKHYGSIQVRSSTKNNRTGTVFSIFLPLNRTKPPTAPDADASLLAR